MAAGNVGKAHIDIDVDGSKVSESLERAMDRALDAVSKSAEASFSSLESDAGKAGDEIGSGIGDGAKAAERALSSIDTDGIDNIGKAANSAADSVSKSSADAADSLSDVGAAGAEAGANASGAISSSMADVTSAAATAGARAADSLSGVGGAASEAGATASGAMAGSMADISASAASAFSGVSASAADAAAGVAQSASNMSSSMTGALSGIGDVGAGASMSLGGVGGAIGGMTQKLGPAAAGLAGLAGAGATVKSGFDKLTSIEDTTASLGIILGDLDQASSLMAKLQEDNLTTPYMFDAYAAAGKTLAAFGGDLEGIPEQVRALGEAAAASGGGQAVFDSMARASGQAMATGKMSLDTINQLAVGGVQGLQILANHFGVPTDEMQKMISQGMVPAQEGMDILTRGILEGSDGIAGATQSMSGVMEEMSETSSGSMTNLLAAFTNLAAAGIEPLVPVIQTIADGLTDFAYIVIDLINGDLDGWMGTVLDIAKPLSITIGALTAAVAGLVLQQKIAAAGGFIKWLGTFSSVSKVATGVQAAFNAVMAANPIVLVTLAIAALVAGLTYFFTKTETGQRIWQGFMDALGAAWEWLSGVFAGVWEVISDAATSAFQWISDTWNTLWGGMQAVWEAVGQPVVDFVVAAFQFWWDGVSLIFRLLGAAWEVLWTGLGMAWEAFGQPVVDLVVAAFQFMWSGVEVIFGWLKSGWDMLWAGVQAVYDAVIAPVVQWVQDRFNDLQSGVSMALDFVKSAIQSAADRVAEFYNTYVQPMVDSVINGFNRVVDTVTGWKDTILGALGDAGRWLWDTGRNIVEGLIEGIKSLAGTIGEAFLNMIPGWIKEPFKVALGIESPSKVFAGFGENIGEGLIEGLRGKESEVGAAVGGMAGAAESAGAHIAVAASPVGVGASVEAPGAPVAAPVDMGGMFTPDMGFGGVGADMGMSPEAMEDLQSATAAASEVIGPALGGMEERVNMLTNATTEGVEQYQVPAWHHLGEGLSNVKAGIIDPAIAGLQQGVLDTAYTTVDQVHNAMNPAWVNAGANMQNVAHGTMHPVMQGIQGAIHNTAQVFGSGTTGMINEWNRLREGTAAPARFTIGTVFNDGIVGMWNSVADMIGTDKMNKHPIAFASGGVLSGYTPGRDVHKFVNPNTGQGLHLSGGEAIMRPEWTRAVGGASAVESMNSAARNGALNVRSREAERNAHIHAMGGVLAFAGGGVVPAMTRLVQSKYPGMQMTSGYRAGDGGMHGQGLAGDFSDGTGNTPAMLALANDIASTYPGSAELIHDNPMFNRNIKNGSNVGKFGQFYTMAQAGPHHHHVHWAMTVPPNLPFGGGVFAGGSSGAGPGGQVDWGEMVNAMLEPDIERIKDSIGGTSFPGMAGDIPGKTFDSMIGPMKDTLVKKVEEMSAFVGDIDDGLGSVERWRPMVKAALARNGFDPSKRNQDLMLAQIRTESGGNPSILQGIQDVNSGGNEAQGLLQIIPGTFAAHRDPALPNDRTDPWANMNAALRYYKSRYGMDLGAMWGKGHGYDRGGLAAGEGFLQKRIVEPERVLNPRQTEAFEAWMAAGQNVEGINDLVNSVGQVQLDHPDVMAADISSRVTKWMSESEGEGDIRALAKALESGIEWQRVTEGMQRSAEAWANGDWVQIAEDRRLATPEEMGTQVGENFLEELADELGGYVGLSGLYKARDIVGETGTMELPKGTDTPVVPTATEAPSVAGKPSAASAPADEDEKEQINVTIDIDVHGAQDPMAVSDAVMSKMKRGLEQSIGGTVRSR